MMRLLAATFVFLLIAPACSTTSQSSTEENSVESSEEAESPTPTEVASLAYEIDLAGVEDGYVDVAVRVSRARGSSDSTTFSISQRWGPLDGIPSFISDVRASNRGVSDQSVEPLDENRWRVFHEPDESAELRYRVTAPDRSDTPRDRMYPPGITNERVFLLGPVALVGPEVGLREHGPITVRIDWKNLPEGWQAASSLGVGASQSSDAPFSQARRLVLYAGRDLRVVRREVEGNQVLAALAGEWTFTDDELADTLAGIVRAQRDFFADHSQGFFLVTARPVDLSGTRYEEGVYTGGTGLYQSFAMFLVPRVKLETEADLGLKHLLAHELFHNWNGQALIRLPDDNEAKVYWFTEGFTEHFTREILLDHGLITKKQYLNDLNDQLGAYQRNPLREVSNAELAKQFWESGDAHDLAYQRGAVIALMLDRRIREHTDGQKSLADAMRRLHETQQPKDASANEYLFDTFGEFAGAKYVDVLKKQVIDGEPVEIGADALGECCRRVDAE